MVKPVRWGVGSPLGSGDQYMSWIHIDDLCRMFLFALENETLQGAYNGTGLAAVTNRELTKAIAKTLKKPLWLPNVPSFVLRVMLGEMANMVVHGSIVSSAKIRQAGFTLQFSDLDLALSDLLKR
jgi:NAD dependent epimerase/dehydratase family enzyme